MGLQSGSTLGPYEIVSLLGAGGMGEVYLAREVHLGRSVALKVLPPEFTDNRQRIARFEQEARSASALNHPNICTIFALGELPDGGHFIAMEYIEGQTLRHRLTADRLSIREALEVGSQIAAGVSAAHARGIVHRDLKPENVSIRSDGLVKVLDFGLAKLADTGPRAAEGTTHLEAKTDPGSAVGTIAYMSPEQARAQEVDARTDIWSLGVVLYEMVAGRSPFAERSSSEVVAAILDREPEPLTRFAPQVPRELQRVVTKALRKDRDKRYQSIKDLQLDLEALHKELPMQPSARADAGTAVGLRRAVAATLLGTVVIGLLLAGWARDRTSLTGRLALDQSPEVLAHEARGVLADLGYNDDARDRAGGFVYNTPFLTYLRNAEGPAKRWPRILAGRPPTILFWYRESPSPFVVSAWNGWVAIDRPPASVPGMRRVSLDPEGRLVGFEAIPRADDVTSSQAVPDWARLFRAAQLDPVRFTLIAPGWTPAVPFDAQAAWTGAFAEQPNIPIRVEAAAFKGRIVAIEIFGPWNLTHPTPSAASFGERLASIELAALMAAGALLAWRNVRAGRADRQGAFRLAAVIFAVRMGEWILSVDHIAGRDQDAVFWLAVSESITYSIETAVFYLALEPYVHRRWPEAVIAWTRLLDGRGRDPRVAREMLVGIASAALIAVWSSGVSLVGSEIPSGVVLDAVLSVPRVAALFIHQFGESIAFGMGFCCLFVVLRVVLRYDWLAGAFAVGLFAWPNEQMGTFYSLGLIASVGFGTILLILMVRSGLVAVMSLFFVTSVLLSVPLTLRASAWFAGVSLFTMGVVIAVAAWAAYVSAAQHTSAAMP